jgi:hypothetical protein
MEEYFFLGPDEHTAFIEFAKLQGDLDALDDISTVKGNSLFRLMVHSKHLFYLMCFVFLPISIQLASVCYSAGAACSLLARNLKSDITGQSFFTNIFVEEETITMIMFVLLALCTW